MGEILLDMEHVLDEMIDDHDIQLGDILNLIYGHLKLHRPDCIEVFEEDDSNPVFKYE